MSIIDHTKISKHLKVPLNRMSIRLEPGDEAYIIRTNVVRTKSSSLNKEGRWTYQKLTIVA